MQRRRAAAAAAAVAQRVRRARGNSRRRRPRRTPEAARPRRVRLPAIRDRVVIRSTTHRRLRLHRRLRQSLRLLHQALLRHRLARRLRRRSRLHRLPHPPFRPLTKGADQAGGMAIRTTTTPGRRRRGENPKNRRPAPLRRTISRRAKGTRSSRSAAARHLSGLRGRVRALPVPGCALRVPPYAVRPGRMRRDRPLRTPQPASRTRTTV